MRILTTALFGLTIFVSTGCATEAEPDVVESLIQDDGVNPLQPLDMLCEGSYNWVDVLMACENAYSNQNQVSQCFTNICSCYECTD